VAIRHGLARSRSTEYPLNPHDSFGNIVYGFNRAKDESFLFNPSENPEGFFISCSHFHRFYRIDPRGLLRIQNSRLEYLPGFFTV
jgi:hypothetical protein